MCHESREKFVYFIEKIGMMKNVSLVERECLCLDNIGKTYIYIYIYIYFIIQGIKKYNK
jgi:hypothetical protein